LKREASALLEKSMASLRRGIGSFNSMADDGRQTAVLLHTQHAAEMLVKAALVEKGVKVMDKQTGRSTGFEKCLNLASEHLGLTADQIGQLRSLDALRDDEQHWLGGLQEELLFVEIRSTIEVLDALLDGVFGRRLADHLPDRALPITTKPVQDYDVLVDRQFNQIKELLETGKRQRVEARAKIRGLLAMEGHTAEDVRVSERDVNRVEKAVKNGKGIDEVFPRLRTIESLVMGEGPSVTVKLVKKGGAPVTLAPADDPNATAVREVDLLKKFHWQAKDLASKVGLTAPKARALRLELGIEEDDSCVHDFRFGRLTVRQYSDNAYTRMRDALDAGIDMNAVWDRHKPRRTTSGRQQPRPAGSASRH
jgi:hypothetical protein